MRTALLVLFVVLPLAVGVSTTEATARHPLCRGPGKIIVGTPRDDVLRGTRGRDSICGLGGDDVIYGRGGNDVLLGGTGINVLWGGRGVDLVDYSARESRIVVELDAGAGSVSASHSDDTLYDIEAVRGGYGADKMTGDAGSQRFFGGDNADMLDGGQGDDLIDAAQVQT